MRPESIVRPRRLPAAAGIDRLIHIPWDLRPDVLVSELKKIAPARRYEMFGSIFRLGSKAVLYGATSAPLACLALEPFLVAGAKEVVLLGFCGSLHPGFRVGDVVSVARALADEGTSARYLPRRRRFLPSGSLRASLEGTLGARGLEFKTGAIVSTDTPYRETRSWLRKARIRGAELVDMETSAVFALAEFYGIRAAALLVVSDELFTGVWRPGFSGPLLRRRASEYFLPYLSPGV